MLDLKSKLLAAGLVTEDQVQKVEQEEEEARRRRREARKAREQKAKDRRGGGKKGDRKGERRGEKKAPAGDDRADAERWQKRLAQLKEAGKSEQYEAIRSWVQRSRIDAVRAIPTEAAERFHFARHDEGIASLTLEPEVKAKILDGSAGICVFMSNNGLAHCVVPRDVALDIGAVRPEWVRVLEGYEVVPNKDELKAREYVAAAEGEAQGEAEAPADGEAQAQADEARAQADESRPEEGPSAEPSPEVPPEGRPDELSGSGS